MTEILVLSVLGLMVIAGTTVAGPRLGIAAPLLLVAIGVVASFLPALGDVEVDPELILAGVLPPLLYSASVSTPTMNFRRELGAISGLSVVLVVGTSLVLGLFFMAVLPDLGFAWGVALGAVVSPTDAVATSIVKRTPVSKRVVAMLEGESLLNDATALVLLRTAVLATTVTFSFWSAIGTFAYSVAVAVVIGFAVGMLNLMVRKRVTDPTVNTVLSFTVPFVASLPAEALGASGLVAAVVAGLYTGVRAPRVLAPLNRLSDTQNWRTVELVLEGAVFLTMGVQIRSIVTDVRDDHAGVGAAVVVALGALAITVLVRAAYVAPLLRMLTVRARQGIRMQDHVQQMHEKMSTPEGTQRTIEKMSERRGREVSDREVERFRTRLTRGLGDIAYFRREPLGWREGTIVVWAGMRGAVTVAAAQTLPTDTPQRPVLVLIAFAVAAISLLVQGGTIGPLVDRLAPEVDQDALDEQTAAERKRLFELLREASEEVPDPRPPEEERTQGRFRAEKEYRLAVLEAQRAALLDARDAGTFDADVLAYALESLDASQIAMDMRGGPKG